MSKVIGEIFKVTVNDDGSRVPQQEYSTLRDQISLTMKNKFDKEAHELYVEYGKNRALITADCENKKDELLRTLQKEYEEHIFWTKSLKPKMISYELTIKLSTNNGKSTIFGEQQIFPKENGEYIVDGGFANEILERHLLPKGIPYSFSWEWAVTV